MIVGSVEDLSVVGGRWNTCRLVGGRLSVVGGSVVGASVKHLSVGRWLVVGGLSVVDGLVIRRFQSILVANRN